MQYIQIAIPVSDPVQKDMIIALLSDAGYIGFEEQEDQLLAFTDAGSFTETVIVNLAAQFSFDYAIDTLRKTNWNKEWEDHFQPVTIEDFCTIRADFHSVTCVTPYEIVITPKMSFGTGHHATTQLMVSRMRTIDFNDKKVFDFGTGTGILAILAEQLGAASVFALDNDEWSYENARENGVQNNTRNIEFALGTLTLAERYASYDVILANINRHVLLESMNLLHAMIARSGVVLMSGLLEEDRDIVQKHAESAGFQFLEADQLINWITLKFFKP